MMYVKDQVLKMVHVIQLRNVKIEKEQAQDPVHQAMEFVVLFRWLVAEQALKIQLTLLPQLLLEPLVIIKSVQ